MSYGLLRISPLVAALALAACGGGGGGSSSVSPALVPAAGPVATSAAVTAPRAPQSASVVISVSEKSPSSARRERYISPSTKSMKVTITPASGAAQNVVADCITSCSATISAPVGVVAFTVGLYSASAAGGSLLSSGSTSTTIVGGQTNTVSLVFGGSVASIALSYDATKFSGGTAASTPLTVAAYDAGGNVIVGSDPYVTPIVLSESDVSGVLALSTTTVTSPATAVSLAYSGGTVGATTITAKAGTIAATANVGVLNATGAVAITIPVPGATATPVATPAPTASPAPTATPGPVAGVPAHVLTYLYYGAVNVNTNVPASYMASKADFVEMSEGQTSIVNAYKAAGGKNALIYTDPTYQPYCVAPLTAAPYGACSGPIAQLISSDSAYYHAANGARIYRAQPGVANNYQEALNLGSSAAQTAYHTFTSNLVAQAPQLDLFQADDSGGSYANSGGDPMTGLFYGFQAPAVEVTSTSDYIAQEKAMLAQAARPVIINGGDVENWKPAYNGAFITAPNVAGENFEGCLNNDGLGLMSDTGNYFQTQSNALLAATAYGRYAVCMMYGTPTPAHRLYTLGAWWMTYDPAWSVAAPVRPTSDGYAVFPEYEIVPRQPVKTATTDVGVLRSSVGGAYVREFGACYQAGVSIGACAAIVNTTAGSVSLPALSRTYSANLALSDASTYTGGKATWTSGIPASLAAGTAVIVRQ